MTNASFLREQQQLWAGQNRRRLFFFNMGTVARIIGVIVSLVFLAVFMFGMLSDSFIFGWLGGAALIATAITILPSMGFITVDRAQKKLFLRVFLAPFLVFTYDLHQISASIDPGLDDEAEENEEDPALAAINKRNRELKKLERAVHYNVVRFQAAIQPEDIATFGSRFMTAFHPKSYKILITRDADKARLVYLSLKALVEMT